MLINLPRRLKLSSGLDIVETGFDITDKVLDIATINETPLRRYENQNTSWEKDNSLWIPTYMFADDNCASLAYRSKNGNKRYFHEIQLHEEVLVATVAKGKKESYGILIVQNGVGELLTRTD